MTNKALKYLLHFLYYKESINYHASKRQIFGLILSYSKYFNDYKLEKAYLQRTAKDYLYNILQDITSNCTKYGITFEQKQYEKNGRIITYKVFLLTREAKKKLIINKEIMEEMKLLHKKRFFLNTLYD